MAQEAITKFFSREGFLNKRGVGIVIGLVILIGAMFVPEQPDLSHQGIMAIASLLFAVSL